MKYIKSTLKNIFIITIILLIVKSMYNVLYRLCGRKHFIAIGVIVLPLLLIKPTIDLCTTNSDTRFQEKRDVEKVFISPTITKEDTSNPWGKSSFE